MISSLDRNVWDLPGPDRAVGAQLAGRVRIVLAQGYRFLLPHVQ
jgi:hypothetical protein